MTAAMTAAKGALSTVVAALSLVTLVGCTSSGTPADASSPAPPPSVDDATVTAIHTTIDAINATAGGSVADQRAELENSATTDQSAEQRACPPANTTLAFDPAYRDLRPAPASTDSENDPSTNAEEYLLPTYITIYTGDRITGSDLTTLQLWVIDGTARTAALCIS